MRLLMTEFDCPRVTPCCRHDDKFQFLVKYSVSRFLTNSLRQSSGSV